MAWTYPIMLDWLTSKFRDSAVLTYPASGLQVHTTRTGIVPRFSGLNSLSLWRSTLPTIYLLGPYVVNNFLYFNCKLSLWNFPLEAPYHFSKSWGFWSILNFRPLDKYRPAYNLFGSSPLISFDYFFKINKTHEQPIICHGCWVLTSTFLTLPNRSQVFVIWQKGSFCLYNITISTNARQ